METNTEREKKKLFKLRGKNEQAKHVAADHIGPDYVTSKYLINCKDVKYIQVYPLDRLGQYNMS